MPRLDVLESYYASYYDGHERDITFSAPLRFARHLIRGLPSVSFGEAVRVLDYGGGNGSLAKAVASRLIALGRARSADVRVVDFTPRGPSEGDGLRVEYQAPDVPIEGEYDLVLASAILEHIPSLRPVLQTLHSAIAPGGFFYARTPYVLPLTRFFPRLDLAYPAHVHDMGSEFWNRFRETFAWDVRVIVSGPSVIAGSLADPVRTLAAAMLKAPAHLENWLSPRSRVRRTWNLVGGWEVLLQKRGPAEPGL
ncbi:MAG: methyltransferase domain-containing protein [Thermoanaerobaculia bacterium]|nr:methyltransferase domain-containing protein [Thermoanaerobaculia bacterium]